MVDGAITPRFYLYTSYMYTSNGWWRYKPQTLFVYFLCIPLMVDGAITPRFYLYTSYMYTSNGWWRYNPIFYLYTSYVYL